MRKTFLSCLLALSMMISLLPTTAIADGGLLMSAGASGGTTYYVSDMGNDTATGTDEAAPLKTITRHIVRLLMGIPFACFLILKL